MKIHILTIGKPKLPYAKLGWEDYLARIKRLHDIRTTHLADKFANDAKKILETIGHAQKIVLEIAGDQFTSPELAELLQKQELTGRETCFIIGGPEGLPAEVISAANLQLSLSRLTLPHDLAMVVLLEALFRASTINAHFPYHK